jgi:hypothetical protein
MRVQQLRVAAHPEAAGAHAQLQLLLLGRAEKVWLSDSNSASSCTGCGRA